MPILFERATTAFLLYIYDWRILISRTYSISFGWKFDTCVPNRQDNFQGIAQNEPWTRPNIHTMVWTQKTSGCIWSSGIKGDFSGLAMTFPVLSGCFPGSEFFLRGILNNEYALKQIETFHVSWGSKIWTRRDIPKIQLLAERYCLRKVFESILSTQ